MSITAPLQLCTGDPGSDTGGRRQGVSQFNWPSEKPRRGIPTATPGFMAYITTDNYSIHGGYMFIWDYKPTNITFEGPTL